MQRQTIPTEKPKQIVFKLFMALVLAGLGGWLLHFNWAQRPVHYRNYTFSTEESQRLRPFARAQYAHGLHAWYQNHPEAAAHFFRQAVSRDVFFLDAWLKLAEAEAALGQAKTAREILKFTTGLTANVVRWKWDQMLLALELDMSEIVYRNANYLLSHRLLTQNTLQFLHLHFGGEVTAVMAVLNPDYLILYLEWLMRWGMVKETQAVWKKIRASGKPDAEIGLQFAHFLLDHKLIAESVSVWQDYRSLDGITNGGFETEISQRGFGWRQWEDRDGNWTIERDNLGAHEGEYALRVSFAGRQNISFQHLYQIVPVTPSARLRLSYAWKSDSISTDQGPYVEIASYDQAGLSESGPMITGTHKWREESIEFQPPDGCRAVLVSVRRRPSHRFDSKIKGSFWLDGFQLEVSGSKNEPKSLQKIL